MTTLPASPDVPELPSELEQLQLLLTERCNLTCTHCAVPAEDSPADHELTTDQWKGFITEVLASRVSRIVLSGGEALLRKDCLELAQHSLEEGAATVVLVSNGTILQRSTIEPLAALQARWGNFRVHISLDGASPRSHDLIRGEGTFDRILTGMHRLRAAGGHVAGIHTVLHQDNLHELPALVDLVKEWAARTWTVFPLASLGRGRDLDAIRLDEADWVSVLAFLASTPLPGVDVGLMGPTLGDEWRSTQHVPATRSVHSPQACVGPDGAVFACPPLRHRPAGAVDDMVSGTPWGLIDKGLRETIGPVCPSCKFRPLCTGVDYSRDLVPRHEPFRDPGPARGVVPLTLMPFGGGGR